MKDYRFIITHVLLFVILAMTYQLSIKDAKIDEQKIQIVELRKQVEERDNTIDRFNQQLGIYDK